MRLGKRTFEYHPVGMDVWDPCGTGLPAGTKVVKCYPAGIGGPMPAPWCYVAFADTGRFYGMVLRNSLQPCTKKGSK
jgi:hypothetical protein